MNVFPLVFKLFNQNLIKPYFTLLWFFEIVLVCSSIVWEQFLALTHCIREIVHDRTIILQYYPTDEQIADIFTKRFSENNFTYLYSLLGVSPLGWSDYFQCLAWGGVFPTRFSLFSSLSLFWALFHFQHCTRWPMALVARALAFLCIYVF